jgi:hypothetical protein
MMPAKRICQACKSQLDEHGCCWTCEAKAESQRYSQLYRCVNKDCIIFESRLQVIDGDEDYVELCCRWCGESFRINIDHGDPYADDNDPTPEDDQAMIDAHHRERYGEY